MKDAASHAPRAPEAGALLARPLRGLALLTAVLLLAALAMAAWASSPLAAADLLP